MLLKQAGKQYVPAEPGQPAIPPSGYCVPVQPPPTPTIPPTQPTPPPAVPPTVTLPPMHVHTGTVQFVQVPVEGTSPRVCWAGMAWSCCGWVAQGVLPSPRLVNC